MLKSRHGTFSAPTPARQRRLSASADRGFTLIELLVASALLLVVLVGLLPLFMRSIMENVEGRESTQVANHGRSELEIFKQLRFNNPELEITAGNESVVQRYWTMGDPDYVGDEKWVDTVPVGEFGLWDRTTTVRQFGINGVIDNDLDGIIDQIIGLEDDNYDGFLDNPLAAGALPGAIHLKEVDVQVESEAEHAIAGEPVDIRMRGLKAF
ncbi:MAG: prepilin-type N-terminal cleavage/methylation domain-containing protein [Nitrospirae bacterium]|nr:prepilin-type N-terminal cleavage/methylation domain-containing protein [Nitrospirota bacterium]